MIKTQLEEEKPPTPSHFYPSDVRVSEAEQHLRAAELQHLSAASKAELICVKKPILGRYSSVRARFPLLTLPKRLAFVRPVARAPQRPNNKLLNGVCCHRSCERAGAARCPFALVIILIDPTWPRRDSRSPASRIDAPI